MSAPATLALPLAALALAAAFMADLSLGAAAIPPRQILAALIAFDPDNYDHYVVFYQRLPRALIALHAGAAMACAGLVYQGLTRNPLAAPATLGVNAGATLFVVAGAFLLDLGLAAQGLAALAGAAFGFASALGLARATSGGRETTGLALVLSGALVSIFYSGLAQALLLSDPVRRADFLSWASGAINHVYAARLEAFGWIGLAAMACLLALSRPLTLLSLGEEKAASAGLHVRRLRWAGLGAATAAAGAAVAVCGPLGFVGLIAPHMARPFAGARFSRALPMAAMLGATACLLADMAARRLAAPLELNAGVILDLVGGLAFAWLVRRLYVAPRRRSA